MHGNARPEPFYSRAGHGGYPDAVAQTSSAILELGLRAKAASRALALASTVAKNDALLAAADLLVARTADILAANERDIARAQQSNTTATVIDRLRLTAARIEAMAAGLRQVAALADPVGDITEG